MNVGKFEKYDEEKVLCQKKCFHFLEAFFYKKEKAQNMPELASRLVWSLIRKNDHKEPHAVEIKLETASDFTENARSQSMCILALYCI